MDKYSEKKKKKTSVRVENAASMKTGDSETKK